MWVSHKSLCFFSFFFFLSKSIPNGSSGTECVSHIGQGAGAECALKHHRVLLQSTIAWMRCLPLWVPLSLSLLFSSASVVWVDSLRKKKEKRERLMSHICQGVEAECALKHCRFLLQSAIAWMKCLCRSRFWASLSYSIPLVQGLTNTQTEPKSRLIW